MSKDRFTLVDTAQLAVATARAFAGDFTAAAVQAIKWRRAITGIIIGIALFIILISSVIISIPSLIMQSMMPGEEYKEPAAYAEAELVNVKTESDSILDEIQEWISHMIADTFGESREGGESVVKSIDADIDYQDVLILYNVKYGGYGQGEGVDLVKIKEIARLFIKKESSTESGEDDEVVLKVTATVRPFTDVMADLQLNELQQAVAVNMYNCLHYNQNIGSMAGNDPISIDLADITFQDGSTEVTYFNQMDKRWSREPYGRTGTIGETGCGPTSLAMVVSSLTNRTVTPLEMANWAFQNGYKCEGNGSYHSLIPAGAKHFGLQVEGVGVKDAQKLVDALSQGKLVIAIMSKGHFTSGGHYIVLRGVTEDGKILVADPASVKRSNQEWDLEIILGEANKRAGAGGPFWVLD